MCRFRGVKRARPLSNRTNRTIGKIIVSAVRRRGESATEFVENFASRPDYREIVFVVPYPFANSRLVTAAIVFAARLARRSLKRHVPRPLTWQTIRFRPTRRSENRREPNLG